LGAFALAEFTELAWKPSKQKSPGKPGLFLWAVLGSKENWGISVHPAKQAECADQEAYSRRKQEETRVI